MTGLSAAGLINDWGAAIAAPDAASSGSPELPCGILRQPWQPPKAPSAISGSGLDPAAPDFGFRFARRFVAACRQGPVPRRRRRGLLRQRGTYKWIRHAIRYLERTEGSSGTGSVDLSPPQLAVAEAIAFNRDPSQRALLRRLLISHGADPDQVVRVLELDVRAVDAYRALFFDIGDRTEDPFRFFTTLQRADEEDLQDDEDSGLPPLAEFACLGFRMAVLHCGLVFDEGEPEGSKPPVAGIKFDVGDAVDCMGYLFAWRTLQVNPDAYPANAKVIGDAIGKYHKVHGELSQQRPLDTNALKKALRPFPPLSLNPEEHEPEEHEPEEHEPGELEPGELEPIIKPEPGPSFVRLTLEDLRRMAGLWQQCAPAASVVSVVSELRTPIPASSLQLPWRRSKDPGPSGIGFPGEMSRPDFASLLAKRVSAAGRSGELPTGGAFHWIRLMAAGLESSLSVAVAGMECAGAAEDPDAAALRRAVELHAGDASRQLLQAALVTRDAKIGEIAGCLGVDARVMNAYVMLFFNLAIRGRDASYRSAIQRRIEAGLDPLDGDSMPPRGLAEVMNAAPRFTLKDLQRLLGFKAGDSRAVDAADRLLELLGRVRQRGGKKRGTGVRQLAKAQLECAVGLAAEKINVYDLGMEGVIADSGSDPKFKRDLRKAERAHQWQIYCFTLTANGLTQEEAQLRWEQRKGRLPPTPPHENQDQNQTQPADEDPA